MCDSCEVLMINGVLCHEHGCPDAWMDYEKECFLCGFDFMPVEKGDMYCPDCIAYLNSEDETETE